MILTSRSFSADCPPTKACDLRDMPLVEKTINDLVDTVHKYEEKNKALQLQVLHRGDTNIQLEKAATPSFDWETAGIFLLVGVIAGSIGAKVIK